MQLFRCILPRQTSTSIPGNPNETQLRALLDAKCISGADFKKLTKGELRRYADVFLTVVQNMDFACSLPHETRSEVDGRWIQSVYQDKLRQQGMVILREADRESPLMVRNLPLTCLYDQLYKTLGARMETDWTDEQTLDEIDALSCAVRHTLAAKCHRNKEAATAAIFTGAVDFAKDQKVYRRVGDKLGLPLQQCPNLGARLCVEQLVRDAASDEYGVDPDNPLLLYMYDAEKNYASGFTRAWDAAMQLIDRLRQNGLASLTVKDIETLHAACVKDVLSTQGARIESAMGCMGVAYGIEGRRGLSAPGKVERQRCYDDLNEAARRAIDRLRLPQVKDDLFFLLDLQSKKEHGGVAMMRRKLFRKKEDNIALVRELGGARIQELLEALAGIDRHVAEHWLPDADKKNAEQLAIVDYEQSMERLHPFPDANGRILEIIMTNVLLAVLGHDAYFPQDPYRFDGYSRTEVRDTELQAGQAAFRTARNGVERKPPSLLAMREAVMEEILPRKTHATPHVT